MSLPEVEPITRSIDQRMIDAYADASGDHNPIHVDPEFARTTPMEGTIAHGMLVLAFLSEMMTRAFGLAWAESGRLDVRLRSPARPGDMVTARARGAAQEHETLKYAVECVNEKGEQLISGSAAVRWIEAGGA